MKKNVYIAIVINALSKMALVATADQVMKQLTYLWLSYHFPTSFSWVRCQPKLYAEL